METIHMADAPTKDQAFATEGIKPLERPSASARLLMSVVGWAERLNLRYAKLPNKWVYENSDFPWAQKLEEEWLPIRQELDRLLLRRDELPSISDISPDAATISTDRGWKTFMLTGYGFTSKRNVALCPNTWRTLQCIPGLTTAMFSIFEPGKRLPAHRGPYNGVLRLHLGLLVPRQQSQTGIRVGGQTCHWQEGRVLIFDDAFEHEAWNDTDQVRVVMFVDFVKPLRFPANLMNRLLISVASVSPFVRDCKARQREWEASFHAP
jgi:aspartyl/asparaginyl beta-hydroxylase (cupin superfamily)